MSKGGITLSIIGFALIFFLGLLNYKCGLNGISCNFSILFPVIIMIVGIVKMVRSFSKGKDRQNIDDTIDKDIKNSERERRNNQKWFEDIRRKNLERQKKANDDFMKRNKRIREQNRKSLDGFLKRNHNRIQDQNRKSFDRFKKRNRNGGF